jgi:hypothetical protein
MATMHRPGCALNAFWPSASAEGTAVGWTASIKSQVAHMHINALSLWGVSCVSMETGANKLCDHRFILLNAVSDGHRWAIIDRILLFEIELRWKFSFHYGSHLSLDFKDDLHFLSDVRELSLQHESLCAKI